MRTTVTLDNDVEILIRRAMKERQVSFKEALNSGLRTGLGSAKSGKRRFLQKTFSLGFEQNFRWDKALSVSESMEDEELARKLALRK